MPTDPKRLMAELYRRNMCLIGAFVPIALGEAEVGVIDALRAREYDGWTVFEQDVDPTKPGVVPKESASASRQYLRKVVALLKGIESRAGAYASDRRVRCR